MKKLKSIIILCLLLFICCQKNDRYIEESKEITKQVFDSLIIRDNDSTKYCIKIYVGDIESQIDEVTSGFLPFEHTQIFIEKPKNNYFGFYYLVKNSPSYNVLGKMIIYDDKKPYQYNSNTEEFIEINLWDKGIILNDSIQVGMSKEKLLILLGANVSEENDILIYRNNEYRCFFKTKHNIITNIKIGKYQNDIDDMRILQYEW